MEKFINDLITFVSQLDPILKVALVGIFALFDILILISFIKTFANKNNKLKIKIATVLLFVICTGIIVFLGVYSF